LRFGVIEIFGRVERLGLVAHVRVPWPSRAVCTA
jgi:hypothetical protein